MDDKKRYSSDSRQKPLYDDQDDRGGREGSRPAWSRKDSDSRDSDDRGGYSRRPQSDDRSNDRGGYSRRSGSDDRGGYSGRSGSDDRGAYSRRSGSQDRSDDRGGYSRRSQSGDRSDDRGAYSRRSHSDNRSDDRGGYSRRSHSDNRSNDRGGYSRRSDDRAGYRKHSDGERSSARRGSGPHGSSHHKGAGPAKSAKKQERIELTSDQIQSVRLEGRLSVTAALQSGRREIQRLFLDRGMDERRKFDIKDAAWKAGAKVEWRKRPELDELAKSTTHGGVVALVGTRQDETLAEANIPETCRFVVMLDGVEDPYSYGQAIRAFYAAGIDLLIRSPRDWGRADATIVRASGGCSELVKTVVADVDEAAAWARKRGFQILTTAKETESTSLYKAEFSDKVLLLIGGEKRGITRSFMSAADAVIGIPYGRDLDVSLGTVAASSILSFEVMRRGKGGADEEVFPLPDPAKAATQGAAPDVTDTDADSTADLGSDATVDLDAADAGDMNSDAVETTVDTGDVTTDASTDSTTDSATDSATDAPTADSADLSASQSAATADSATDAATDEPSSDSSEMTDSSDSDSSDSDAASVDGATPAD